MSIYDQVLARLPNKEIAVTKDVIAITCAVILEYCEEHQFRGESWCDVDEPLQAVRLDDLKQLLQPEGK